MAALSGLAMGLGTAVSAGSSIIGSRAQANAQRAQGEFEKAQYDMNARLAQFQAEDALGRGEQEVGKARQATAQTIGAQRAATAAQGIDVGSGSALDIQADTAGMGALDVMTIRNNARREAFGYKVQAADYKMRGRLAKRGAQVAANATLLTGGLNAAGAGMSGIASISRIGGGGSSGGGGGGYSGGGSSGGSYTNYGGYA